MFSTFQVCLPNDFLMTGVKRAKNTTGKDARYKIFSTSIPLNCTNKSGIRLHVLQLIKFTFLNARVNSSMLLIAFQATGTGVGRSSKSDESTVAGVCMLTFRRQ